MAEATITVLDQLDQLEEIVLEGSRIPFSGGRLVNEQDAAEVIDALRDSLPRQFELAADLLRQREEFIAQARKQAEEIVAQGRRERDQLVASQSVRQAGPGGGAVLVDFTHPSVVYEHTRGAIAYGVHPVIGTTGLSPEQLADLASFAEKASVGGAVIPNFSVGMVLLQQAAAAAARFYDFAELTELHHNRKADAPSGTCIKTAELMEELGKSFNPLQVEEHETLAGCRGGQRDSGLRLHSIRLPGLVAHQEVMFGAPGETYTLRHDTIDRSAYMPGVLLTVRRVRTLGGLVYGLERLL